jgi:hypothetical protein
MAAKRITIVCDACSRDLTLKDGRGGYRLKLEIETVWGGGPNAPVPPLVDPFQFHFCDPACLRSGLDREHPGGRPLIALPAPMEEQEPR